MSAPKFFERLFHYLPLFYLAALLGLVGLQAYAYYHTLSLSLGPFVIFMPAAMHQGYLPYDQLFDVHAPLLPLLISIFALPSVDGLSLAKLFLITLITLSTLITFWAGKRQSGWLGGLGTAAFFVCWSVSFGFPKLWHETLLTPLYALLLILVPPSTSRRSVQCLIILGLLGGIAMLAKQHAVFVVGAMLGWQILTYRRARQARLQILCEVGLVAIFALVPLLVYAIYYYLVAGTLGPWLYWTLTYNLTSNFVSLGRLVPTIDQIWGISPAYLLIPAAVLYTIHLKRNGDATWEKFAWALILLGASSLTVLPRFEFFHLDPSLPMLAWLSVITLMKGLKIDRFQDHASRNHSPWIAGITFTVLILWLLKAVIIYQYLLTPEPSRKIWEYSDLVPVAAEIRQHIGATGCVYIFPDDEATANLYYLLRCPPPKFWILNYPWDMGDSIRERILSTLEDSPPRWIVYPVGRWGIETRAPEIMLYIQDNYQYEAQLDWAQGPVQLLKRRP